MNHGLIVSKSIEINVEPSKVWKGLKTPEIIKEYLFGTETITDWKQGNEIIFQGEYEGQQYKDKGIIKENIPHKLLSYSYWSSFSGLDDKPENYSTVTYALEPIDDNKTKFTWTQSGYANEEGHKHSEKGMDEFLEKVKEVIEKS